jgi:hypothetical protein
VQPAMRQGVTQAQGGLKVSTDGDKQGRSSTALAKGALTNA